MPNVTQAHRMAQAYSNINSPQYQRWTKTGVMMMTTRDFPRRSNSIVNLLLISAIAANLRVAHPCPAWSHRNTSASGARRDPSRHAGTMSDQMVPDQPQNALRHCVNNAHGIPLNDMIAKTGNQKSPGGDCHTRPAQVPARASRTTFLPMADAMSAIASGGASHWDATRHIMTLVDDNSKVRFISALRDFLIKQGISSEDDANRLEFIWRQQAVNAELSVATSIQPTSFSRDKRISQATREKNIAAHIKENCAFETEIINTQGTSEGTVLLLYAQRAENPFHLLLEGEDNHTPSEWTRHGSNGMNFVSDVITFGIKPVIGNLFAAFLRRQHYLQKDDQICATRNVHIMFAEIATALTIDGLPLRSPSHHLLHKPTELIDNLPSPNRAAYFARNKNTGVQTEILITAKTAHTADEAVETIFLKPQGESRFIPVEIDAANQGSPTRSLVYDDHSKTWRFANSEKKSPVEVELFLGDTFATIGGEQYKLHQTKDMQYEIMIRRKNGQQQYLPVYKEPISNNWYLKTANHHASFTPRQRALINTLRVPSESDKTYIAINNENPALYGEGKIYQVVTQDEGEELYNVVEMNGELIPVRKKRLANHEMLYEAFNLASPADKHYPIEWDGERWKLETATSPHICSALKQYITPDMYAVDINTKDLSPPNQRGVRRSPDGRTFIRVNHHYVEIHHGKKIVKGAPLFKEIMIEYKDHQFHFAPGGAPPDFGKQASHSSMTSQFYAQLQEDAKSVTPHRLTYKRVVNATTTMFPGEKISVRQIASADLNKRRYLFSKADEEYWFLETAPDGTHMSLLGQAEQQRAMEKYQARASGGSVQHAFTVRLQKQTPLGLEPNMQIIGDITRKRIEAGWLLIKQILEKQGKNKEKVLILGHDDFFESTSFAKNSYASMEDAYEKLTNLFIPLSRLYPDAIIAPGSIYISQDIPQPYRENQNIYIQGGSEGELKNAVHFSANIAPVFHGGKIIAIARQGEYLTYQASPRQTDRSIGSAVELRDLDRYIARQSIFTVPNCWDHPHDDPIDTTAMRLGTVFTGKTLLPGEKAVANRLLRHHLTATNTAAYTDIQALFNNEFIIDEEKFLLVIGDEFKVRERFRPSARNLALPTDDDVVDGNRYDWILHASQEEQMDELMCSVADNCLIVDDDGQTEYFSENTPRIPIREHFPIEDTVVYDYQID